MRCLLKVRHKASKGSLILVTLFPLLMMGLGIFLCCQHRGFSVDKIASFLPHNPSWETPELVPQVREQFAREVFAQPFYYLGSGRYCYAFVSSDGKYVLKFFKMSKLLPKMWAKNFPFSLFERFRFENVEKKELLLQETFQSFKDAYLRLKEDTGLLYLHLNRTRELRTKVELYDKKGAKFIIDIDTTPFALQWKAEKIYSRLSNLAKTEKWDEARGAVHAVLELIADRTSRGFSDGDCGVGNNYGFVGDRPILIDFGSISYNDAYAYPHRIQHQVLELAERMDHWAMDNIPELSAIIAEEAQAVIDANCQ